jgi:hypothetical protein
MFLAGNMKLGVGIIGDRLGQETVGETQEMIFIFALNLNASEHYKSCSSVALMWGTIKTSITKAKRTL